MIWLLLWDLMAATTWSRELTLIVAVRCVLIALFLLTVLLSFKAYWAQRLHQLALVVLSLTVAGFVVLVHQGFALGWYSPVSGVLLVLLYVHAFLALSFREKVVLSTALSIAYVLLVIHQPQVNDLGYQLTFLLMTNLVIATISWSLEQSQLRLYRRILLLETMAHTDQLTGTLNRHGFRDAFSEICQRAEREDLAVGVFIIDIDHFKSFNDGLGHLAGDDALIRVAQALMQARYHPADLVMRFGGEEFVCVFVRKREDQLIELAERLRQSVVDCGIVHPVAERLTVSVGASVVQQPDAEWRHDMMTQADALLYQAKEQGRNRSIVACFQPS